MSNEQKKGNEKPVEEKKQSPKMKIEDLIPSYRSDEWKLISRVVEGDKVVTTEAMNIPMMNGVVQRDTVCIGDLCTVTTVHIPGIHVGTIREGKNSGGFCYNGGNI